MIPVLPVILLLLQVVISGHPGDELLGVNFNDDVSLALTRDAAFTNDSNELAIAVSAVRAEGRTALYDGVAEGLRHVALARQIARDLREQYTLGFSPGTSTNGQAFRKITATVSAAGRGRLRARARTGYMPAPDKDERR